MRSWVQMVGVGFCLAVPLQGCRSSCDGELIERAVAFMEAHQSCESNDDCRVVRDFCEELPGGYCGQLTMNRQGAESAEWRALEMELRDCAEHDCAVCLAALEPGCGNGSCGGPAPMRP